MTTDGESPETASEERDAVRGRRWMRAAYVIWVLLFVAFAANAFLHPRPKLVFLIFSNAARHWWGAGSIYAAYEGLDVYRYSPTFAVLLSPLGPLPDRLGVVVWNLISIAVLFRALRVLARDLLPGRWPEWREGLFLFLCVVGTVRGIWSGQTNALVTACAIFACAAVVKRRWWSAAFLLAGPVFIKVWPIALFLLLAARWRRELIGRFGAACAVFAAVPFLTRAPAIVAGEYVAWYETLIRTAPLRWRGYSDAWTIWEQFGPVDELVYLGIQLLTAGAVLGWTVWRGRRGSSARHHVMSILAVWVGWQLLFGPGTERLTYGLIAPFTTWAMLESYRDGRLRGLSTAAWLLTGILGSGIVRRRLAPFLHAAPAIQPFGVVLYLIWLLIRESRRTQDAATGRAPRPP